MNLPKAVASHCEKNSVPPTFQSFLLHAVDMWLGQQTLEPERNQNQPTQQLVTSQNRIGWTNFTRGLLANEWVDALQSEVTPERPLRCPIKTFFAQLIVVLWNAQTSFWKAYQDRRHTPNTDPTKDSEQMLEIKGEIKYLFSFRDQVLPSHQQTYFPQDLDVFLQHSTITQLQGYILNYGKAIKLSIQQHKTQSINNTRNIFTYHGFERVAPTNPTTQAIINPNDETETGPTPIPDSHATTPINQPPPILIIPPPIPPPPNIVPIAEPVATPTIRRQIQQSLFARFRRRRNIQETTPPQRQETPIPTAITFIQNQDDTHQTVGEYINQMNQYPALSTTSTTGTEEITNTPVIATQASSNYKHSKWRPAARVREKFSQYFRS